MTEISFESENLVVDYVALNISGVKDPKPIAEYLSYSFGFNSIFKKGEQVLGDIFGCR